VVYLITGIQAAGKSTVAQLLAERLPRSVHVRGDLFRRMVVNGRADMTPDPPAEAVRQLLLRYKLAATVTDAYHQAGFTVVVQDIVLAEALPGMVKAIQSRPLHVVVLAPRPDVIAAREQARAKTAYGDRWTVAQLDEALRRDTPRVGLWLDTSEQTPAETVDEILRRAPTEAAV
jgi:chloramphenicol 3-O-phosphotransferase